MRFALCVGERAGLRALAVAVAVAGVFAAPAPSRAADESAAPAAQSTDLGEVVVQARRRDEKILDVPVAVTVTTGEQLQENGSLLFEDVARDIPNLHMAQSPRSTSALDVSLRGQSAISAAIVYDPAVGIYVDGVYVANGQAAMSTLLDIDTVEVVRGAQGTLFGRNNTGGAILFSTVKPQLGAFSAEASVAAGTQFMHQARAIVNAPLGETVAVRLAYQSNDRAGYGSSVGSGQGNFGNQHRYQVRLSALWKPAPGTEADVSYEHFQANEVGALLHPLHGTSVEQISLGLNQLGVAASPVPGDFYQTAADQWSHDHSHYDAISGTLSQRITDSVSAKLILGYRKLHNESAIDADAMSIPFANTVLDNSSLQRSGEAQISGKLFTDRLDWIVGAYGFLDKGDAPSVVPPTAQPYLTLFPGFGIPAQSLPVIQQNTARNESNAAYAHGEYKLGDRWSMAAGFRRTADLRKLSENDYLPLPTGPACTILDATTGLPPNPGSACPPINLNVQYTYWSWEFSSRYRLSDEVNLYVRSGRAQRSGGWNSPINTIQNTPFRPERVTDFEIGAKADLGGALLVSGDIFSGHYDEMQRLLPRFVNGTPTTYVVNAGKARVSGFEAEAVARLTRSASLNASLGWTSARYSQFQYSPGAGQPTIDLSGNQFSMVPKFTGSVGGQYEFALESAHVRMHADYAFQSRVEFNVINDFNNQGGYGTLNLRATYAPDQSKWDVSLFAINATNRKYAVTGGSIDATLSPAITQAVSWQVPSAPALYGAEFVYRFGK